MKSQDIPLRAQASHKTQAIRLALAQINVTVGDLKGNADKVIARMREAEEQGVDIISFPELVITGYPPEDLLLKPKFVADNLTQIRRVAEHAGNIVAVVGFVATEKKEIFNAAAIIQAGKMRGVYHKSFLPNYGVFDEMRYFAPGKNFPVFGIGASAFGVNICEDIWHLDGPAGTQAYRGARFIININASPFHMGKGLLREKILKQQAKKNHVLIAYTNLVGGQDELVFDGQSLVVDASGRLIARAAAFKEELLVVDIAVPKAGRKPPMIFKGVSRRKPVAAAAGIAASASDLEEVYAALTLGLRDYIFKNGFKKVVLGLSGGIDSSLVAAIAADAIGPENVVGVSMPSGFTSQDSKDDAGALAGNLKISFLTVPIGDVFERYLDLLKPCFGVRAPDVTEENLQARIRGNILMALSNKFGYLALNTGNKSEVSCGYCTLYGDMAGGFGVIKDVPKTLVYDLCAYRNETAGRELIPRRVFEKAPTAELRPNQKDSDSLPEYKILDPALKCYVEEDMSLDDMVCRNVSRDVAERVMRLVDLNEYKRRQAPPGIKITPKAFGRDRRMPITNRYR
jgi:NAD+ synthase (glutamine-hydrolysing)